MFLESMLEPAWEQVEWVRAAMRLLGFQVVERPAPFCFVLEGGAAGMDAIPGYHGMYLVDFHCVIHSQYKSTTLWHELCHSQQDRRGLVVITGETPPEGYGSNIAEAEARCIELVRLIGMDVAAKVIARRPELLGDACALDYALAMEL